jgi:ribonuclease HI
MPWAQALLREQTVYARVGADGAFVTDDGRVEIRYKKNDPRAYKALAKNLTLKPGQLLADDAFPAGEFVAPKSPEEAKAAKGAKPGKTGPQATPTGSEWAGARPSASRSDAGDGGPVWSRAVVAYADGACSGNPGPAGSGVYLLRPDGSRREEFVYLGVGTNNIAELTAILKACDAVDDDIPLVIHTDSQYSIGVLVKGWKAKANQELIASVKAAIARRDHFKLLYVAGHAGISGNERADQLAREAVSTRKSGARESKPASASEPTELP